MIGVYITHCIGIVHHASSFDLFNTLLGQLGRGPVSTVSGIMLLVDQKRQHMMQQHAATTIRNALIFHLNPFNQEKRPSFPDVRRVSTRSNQDLAQVLCQRLWALIALSSFETRSVLQDGSGYIKSQKNMTSARTWCLVGGIIHNHPKHS